MHFDVLQDLLFIEYSNIPITRPGLLSCSITDKATIYTAELCAIKESVEH